MKQCTKCGLKKPLSEFYQRKSRNNSYETRCKICRYAMHRKNKKEQMSTKEGHIQNFLWHARNRAKTKELECSVSLEYLIKIAPTHCPVFGYELSWAKLDKKANYNSPSLDRINSNLGYTKENVQWLSWRANSIKNNLTEEEAKQFAIWILKRP